MLCPLLVPEDCKTVAVMAAVTAWTASKALTASVDDPRVFSAVFSQMPVCLFFLLVLIVDGSAQG